MFEWLTRKKTSHRARALAAERAALDRQVRVTQAERRRALAEFWDQIDRARDAIETNATGAQDGS
jgi:hypothetical protein